MLVLSRKVGEKLVIGDNITLTVVAVDRHHIKLGLEAPDPVRILRAELVGRRLPAEETEADPDPDLAAKPQEWLDPAASSASVARSRGAGRRQDPSNACGSKKHRH
jgi:carbon storage regulator